MKNILLGTVFLACIAGLSYVPNASAGDDPLGITLVADSGVSTCSAALTARSKYAVQCTSDTRVHISYSGAVDGGPEADFATAHDVKVGAGVLYDIPTTGTQRYICILADTVLTSCELYLNRGTAE